MHRPGEVHSILAVGSVISQKSPTGRTATAEKGAKTRPSHSPMWCSGESSEAHANQVAHLPYARCHVRQKDRSH